jgi:hypothetical protein
MLQRSALRDLGYVDGRNITLVSRYGDGFAERMPSLARELIALNPDVILTGAISGVLAAYNATRTIPIVTITPEDLSGIAPAPFPCRHLSIRARGARLRSSMPTACTTTFVMPTRLASELGEGLSWLSARPTLGAEGEIR